MHTVVKGTYQFLNSCHVCISLCLPLPSPLRALSDHKEKRASQVGTAAVMCDHQAWLAHENAVNAHCGNSCAVFRGGRLLKELCSTVQ